MLKLNCSQNDWFEACGVIINKSQGAGNCLREIYSLINHAKRHYLVIWTEKMGAGKKRI